MAIAPYLDLDLSHQSPIAQDLFARAEREGRRPSLNLTGDGDPGAASANLTPEMVAWMGAHVGSRRQAALTTIEGTARDIRTGGNTPGIVAEIEGDKLRRERNLREAEETGAYYRKHKDEIDNLNKLQFEHDGLRAAEGDRDAIVPSRLIEWGLPLLVAVPEGFMNYSSFVALAGLGIAGLGITIVVGGAIGVAAWMAGRFWKAWHFYMRADDRDQQHRGLRMIAIASVVLAVALVLVGYARYRTVAEKALEAIILGLTPPNPIVATALLLSGNLLVFCLGAAITYNIHDENPDFAKKAHDLRTARKSLDDAKRRQLDNRLTEIGKAHRQKLDQMLKRVNAIKSHTEYGAVEETIGQLGAKDQEVIGLLQSYRTALVGEIEPRDPGFRFNATAQERQGGNISGTIGLSEFTALPLHLYRGVR